MTDLCTHCNILACGTNISLCFEGVRYSIFVHFTPFLLLLILLLSFLIGQWISCHSHSIIFRYAHRIEMILFVRAIKYTYIYRYINYIYIHIHIFDQDFETEETIESSWSRKNWEQISCSRLSLVSLNLRNFLCVHALHFINRQEIFVFAIII